MRNMILKRNHLVIPDAHSHPDYDNERFKWLGNYIIDTQPDVIVCIGDFADLPSLSSYDRGTRGFEGRRYRSDVLATLHALDALFNDMRQYNAKQQRNRKKQYQPEIILTLGNHEYRIIRATQHQPELYGTISYDDLGYNQYFDRIVPFGENIEVDGITYTHYFSTGVSGRPISGENVAKAMLTKNHTSCVQGHSHLLDYATMVQPNGNRIHAISCGCYVHEDYIADWCRNARHHWWNGVVYLEGVKDGDIEQINFIEQNLLKERYG